MCRTHNEYTLTPGNAMLASIRFSRTLFLVYITHLYYSLCLSELLQHLHCL